MKSITAEKHGRLDWRAATRFNWVRIGQRRYAFPRWTHILWRSK